MKMKFEIDPVQALCYVLSALTITSCVYLKVPQIAQIKRRKTAAGIYVKSIVLEITGYTITALYNFINSYGTLTYLEYPIILAQLYVMLFYVLKYKRMLDPIIVPLAAVFYVTVVVSFLYGFIPITMLNLLVPLSTPLSGFAKMSYIYGIIAMGNSDAVSLTTWIISVATNLARMFTVYIDSADLNLLFNFSVSTVLSTGVLCSALYYKRPRNVPRERPRPMYKPHMELAHSHSD